MSGENYGPWIFVVGGLSVTIGAIISVWAKNTFMKRGDCVLTQKKCSSNICSKIELVAKSQDDKINQLRQAQIDVFEELRSIAGSLSKTNSELSKLSGAFSQYLSDTKLN